ncbi:MAG TPA: NUDIX hydrolase [Candidatus Edwardsbacteria bacterium]|nr:NUDIX hydrolase [Candidatus Edwardsbacteria bacterium]
MTPARDRRPWRVEATRPVYRNPWLRVHEDAVRRPDGSLGRYGIVDVGDAVAVVALSDDAVCLVRQYRPSWKRAVWEVPCGGIHRGERPLSAAKRELREEAGITARSWKGAGVVRANDPVVNTFHVFLARGLKFGEPARDQSEADMVMRMWRFPELKRAIARGAIDDDMSLACIFKCLMLADSRL